MTETFLFGRVDSEARWSWRVEADDESEARNLLHCYMWYNDPHGHLVTRQNINDNFVVIKSHEIDVNKWIDEHIEVINE